MIIRVYQDSKMVDLFTKIIMGFSKARDYWPKLDQK